jgi:hypothetical protein
MDNSIVYGIAVLHVNQNLLPFHLLEKNEYIISLQKSVVTNHI